MGNGEEGERQKGVFAAITICSFFLSVLRRSIGSVKGWEGLVVVYC